MWRGSSGWNETIWRTISTCCRRRDLLLVRHWEWCHFLCKRGKKKICNKRPDDWQKRRVISCFKLMISLQLSSSFCNYSHHHIETIVCCHTGQISMNLLCCWLHTLQHMGSHSCTTYVFVAIPVPLFNNDL